MKRLDPHGLIWGLLALVLAAVVGAALWTLTRPRQGGWDERPLQGPGSFGAVPDFSLIERSGRQVRLSDLRGKVWVVDFIYTACQDSCPLQSAEMSKLQEEFKGRRRLVLVSISVDPGRDTPEVLSAYARRYGADPERWLFLTGEREAIYRLAQKGFRLSAVPASDRSKDILHSSRFVLIDGRAQIQGYYDSREPGALRRLRLDLNGLLS